MPRMAWRLALNHTHACPLWLRSAHPAPPCQPTLPAAPPQAIIRAVRLAVAVGVAMLAVLLALKVQKARCRGVVVRWAPLSRRWGGTMQAEWPGRSPPWRRMPHAAHGPPSPSAHARPAPL